MKYIEDLREAACKELERFAKAGDISTTNIDKIHKLTDIIKNIDKIEMLEDGYSEDWGGEGRIYGTSYRGRRGNVKRDSMGRYSRGEDDEHMREDTKERMLDNLGSMMENANPNEREALKRAMREIERA